jgi:nickel-dependent lactate racemase
VIIVDDCTRPTPAARVLPHLLEELQAAGIPADAVGIVVATGTHGPPATRRCGRNWATSPGRIAGFTCTTTKQGLVHLGRDSRSTPVLFNQPPIRQFE